MVKLIESIQSLERYLKSTKDPDLDLIKVRYPNESNLLKEVRCKVYLYDSDLKDFKEVSDDHSTFLFDGTLYDYNPDFQEELEIYDDDIPVVQKVISSSSQLSINLSSLKNYCLLLINNK